jgi:hypothetical protein
MRFQSAGLGCSALLSRPHLGIAYSNVGLLLSTMPPVRLYCAGCPPFVGPTAIRAYSTTRSCFSIPTVQKCPEPTCPCSATPSGLDIDHKRSLSNTMAPYSQHLVIFTGRRDWTSRIENDGIDTGWGDLGRGVKNMMSPREHGEFVDVS